MKIAEDIYLVGDGQIRLSHKLDCHVYLIDGDEELALIDAGVGLESQLIIDNIIGDGFNPRDIDFILATHSHSDHAGGCRSIKSETGCILVASEIEDRLIEEGSDVELGLDTTKYGKVYPQDYEYPHCKVDKVVKDGEEIRVGKYTLKAIQVPGHSPGDVCWLLEQEKRRVLFTNDVVFLGGTIGLGNWLGSDLQEYRKNIGKLANLNIDSLFPGHYLWTLRDGQEHLDKAIENLKQPFVPPCFQHNHPHF